MRANLFPIDLQEAYEERAAIMEFDGNMSRSRAEAEALVDTLRKS